ncbi:MAG: antibiotic biosynthesis monooxygenase [Bryobacteraceae bacterium]|nr:antibiotic biosynthesis monooxygenase [Bryobacteraceae bacterium]
MILLTVVATIKAKQGKEEEVREALLTLVEPTRGEAGCMQYEPHLSTEVPGEFVFVEKWSDQQALDKHMKSTHYMAVSARLKDSLAEPPSIRTYQKLA